VKSLPQSGNSVKRWRNAVFSEFTEEKLTLKGPRFFVPFSSMEKGKKELFWTGVIFYLKLPSEWVSLRISKRTCAFSKKTRFEKP
jgi:hypothetical protein